MYDTITKASPVYLAGLRDLLCDGDTMNCSTGRSVRADTTVGDVMLMNALADVPEAPADTVEVVDHLRYQRGEGWTSTGAVYAACSCGWTSSPIFRDDRSALARAAGNRHLAIKHPASF